MIQLRKLLTEQGVKKYPPTNLDEQGAKAFIMWMQRNRPSAYESIGLSTDLAATPENERIREAYFKFGTSWFKQDPDAKYQADPKANDLPQSESSDESWGWVHWLIVGILGVFGLAALSRLNKWAGLVAGTESGKFISTNMFKTYRKTALEKKISLLQYLETISEKQNIWIRNKQGDFVKLTQAERDAIQKALKNPAVRKAIQIEITEWGIEQIKKRAITADELAIMLKADNATHRAFKEIEKSLEKSFSKVAPKRTTIVKGTNPTGKTGKMINSEISETKPIYKKEHSITLTQFDQAAKGQIPAADIAKTFSAMAPKGKLTVNMPSSILRLKTFPTKESWIKHYNNAGIPVPTAKDAYTKDKIRYNFLRN